MENIQKNLSRLREIIDKKETENQLIKEIIFKRSGVKIQSGEIIKQEQKLRLKLSPLKRNQILLKQKVILLDLSDQFGRLAPNELV